MIMHTDKHERAGTQDTIHLGTYMRPTQAYRQNVQLFFPCRTSDRTDLVHLHCTCTYVRVSKGSIRRKLLGSSVGVSIEIVQREDQLGGERVGVTAYLSQGPPMTENRIPNA